MRLLQPAMIAQSYDYRQPEALAAWPEALAGSPNALAGGAGFELA